jgi:hypothetical protein
VNFEINSVLPSLLLVFVEKVLTCLFTPPLGNFHHTTRMCHVTIQKQKEIAEAAAQQSQPKQVMHTASYHSLTFQNMWVIILQLLLLRQVNLRHLGNSFHLNHQYNEASSQKGASTFISNETSERSPKLVQ